VIANEVVGLLRTLGLVTQIDESIMGLTIFAFGNSLGGKSNIRCYHVANFDIRLSLL
jgi:Ca2+/Na+ antiporter